MRSGSAHEVTKRENFRPWQKDLGHPCNLDHLCGVSWKWRVDGSYLFKTSDSRQLRDPVAFPRPAAALRKSKIQAHRASNSLRRKLWFPIADRARAHLAATIQQPLSQRQRDSALV
jgi:hypothetical protein